MTASESKRASIIIPTLNEAKCITETLLPLQPLRQKNIEIILSDGGSVDDTVLLASPLVDEVVTAPAGRASQMNYGAVRAVGELLLFLHADTQLPPLADPVIDQLLTGDIKWGFFAVRLSGRLRLLRMVEWFMNWRSSTFGTGTGDQVLFVRRDLFEQEGGYDDIALMEDIAFCNRFRNLSKPYIVKQAVVTSSRRWEEQGLWKTIWLMWRLRFAYYCGVDPNVLVRDYYRQ